VEPKSSPEEAIVVQEDPAYTDSTTTENTPAPELQSGEDDTTVAVAAPPSSRGRGGRGRGRGRGRGGRGGGRGGRNAAPAAVGEGPEDAAGTAPKSTRGKGGHRVKKSDNARVQSMYLRKHNVKAQYKHVLQYQKKALDVIAEKSLDMVLEDPKAHEKIPEYFQTKAELDLIYRKRIELLDKEAKMRTEYLAKIRAIKEEITRKQFAVSLINYLP
jgi:hypothetical protein